MKTASKRAYNREVYKLRNIIKRFFNRLKHSRGIATRYAKRGCCFLGSVQLAAIITMLNN